MNGKPYQTNCSLIARHSLQNNMICDDQRNEPKTNHIHSPFLLSLSLSIIFGSLSTPVVLSHHRARMIPNQLESQVSEGSMRFSIFSLLAWTGDESIRMAILMAGACCVQRWWSLCGTISPLHSMIASDRCCPRPTGRLLFGSSC